MSDRRLGGLRRWIVPERRRPAGVRHGQDRRGHRRGDAVERHEHRPRNAGDDAGITQPAGAGRASCTAPTWVFGPGGNLEGTFKASVGTGDVEWVTDCHGDVYSASRRTTVSSTPSVTRTTAATWAAASPQYPDWRFQHSQAWTDAVGGEILNDTKGYPNWHGVEPGPSMIDWLPGHVDRLVHRPVPGRLERRPATTTTSSSAASSRASTASTSRASSASVAVRCSPRQQRQQGPAFLNNQIVPTLVPTSPTSVRVSWLAGFDRDDLALQYDVFRVGVRAGPLHDDRQLELVDDARRSASSTPGSRRARPTATGSSSAIPTTTSSTAPPANVTMPAACRTNAYGNRVRADGARSTGR